MKWRLGIIVLLLLSLVLNGCVGVKTPSYVVSGSVMDKETREPVSGVEILLNGTTADITKDDGTWTISGVKKGAKVTAEKPGWSFWAMGEGQDVVRGDKQVIRFLGVQTEKPFAVDGVVHDALGNPVSGVAITFEQTDNGSKSTVVTGPDGRFVRSNLSGVLKVTPQKTHWTFEPPYATVYEDTSLYFKGVQTTYTVSGYVEDEQGQPIERAVVTFVDSLNQVSTVLTNANGFFVKSGLRGEYKVSASKPGFSFTPAVEVVTDARELLFTGKGTLYAVTGRVVTPSGEPIENAVITFVDEDQTTVTILSDSNGSFVQTGLSGTVLVQVSKPGYVFEPSTQTVTGATSLVFTGRGTSYTVSGFVQDDAGVPIANAVITFTFVDADNATTAVLSDSEGKFTQSGLSGNVKVTASKPGFKFSPEAHQISGATFLVFRGEGTTYTVSGRVEETGTGNPIPYAVITFVQDGETIREILTNEYGFFWESGFTGTVQVQASKPGFAFAGEGYTVTGPRELLFSGTGTTYSVSGRVIDQESYKGLSGALITFELLDESGNPTGLEIDAQSDEDGQFFLSGLSGEYTVTASLPGFTFSQIHRVSKETHGLTFRGLARP